MEHTTQKTGRAHRGVSETDVWRAADALLLEGKRPTIESVRHRIGRGSPNTVTPYLDTWFKTLGQRLRKPGQFEDTAGVPEPVRDAAVAFWEAAAAAARTAHGAEVGRATAALDARAQALAEAERGLAEANRIAEARASGLDQALAISNAALADAKARVLALEKETGALRAELRSSTADARKWQKATDEERMARDRDRKILEARLAGQDRYWQSQVERVRIERLASPRRVNGKGIAMKGSAKRKPPTASRKKASVR